VSAPSPERALRLALIGWGLGDLALGRSRAAVAWLALEAVLLAATASATLLLSDTTWYLVPYLLGVAFLVIWAGKAVATHRRAQHLQGAAPTNQPKSPAATIAWLTLPLLAWGTGFWLIAGEGATPAAVMDRFVTRWADIVPIQSGPITGRLGDELPVERAAALALFELQELCDAGRLADDCDAAPENLLRDVRVTITQSDDTHATAEADVVDFRRRPSTLFGIFQGSEMVPVPVTSVLTLRLEAQPTVLGAREWVLVNATAE
jgi:hypothetical protein